MHALDGVDQATHVDDEPVAYEHHVRRRGLERAVDALRALAGATLDVRRPDEDTVAVVAPDRDYVKGVVLGVILAPDQHVEKPVRARVEPAPVWPAGKRDGPRVTDAPERRWVKRGDGQGGRAGVLGDDGQVPRIVGVVGEEVRFSPVPSVVRRGPRPVDRAELHQRSGGQGLAKPENIRMTMPVDSTTSACTSHSATSRRPSSRSARALFRER